MLLRRSRFTHLIPLSQSRALVVHAVSHLRLSVDREVAAIVEFFDRPRTIPDEMPALRGQVPYDIDTLAGCLASLMERGFLTDKTPEEEQAELAAVLGEAHGRDPAELLERHRRERREGALPAWAVARSSGVAQLVPSRRKLELLVFGDCDVQMEADFLKQEAAGRGVDLRIGATFPDDPGFAGERAHDAILVGALRSRGEIARRNGGGAGGEPWRAYVEEARRLLTALRDLSAAPILIDNLPEPTVQPLGFADRGPDGHRNRFRQANLALERLAESFPDVHVVDVAAALNAAGSGRLLDDGLISFAHFGSPGWMLQRPESEKAAVHGLFPDTAPLAASLGGDPYGREAVTAAAHLDALGVVLGLDRKKVVVVDLDGVLWPGVLAETGSPFAWTPETSGTASYVGLYFGIHEALKTLKRRGILLACVSKNDEATVRELWRFSDAYPRDRLLTPEDFVTWRVNWQDKVANIASIAEELGLALDSFVFIDDRQDERENVRTRLPMVEVMGEDLFALRRRLLSDPRLQLPQLTAEAEGRTHLVKAQLDRQRLRDTIADAGDFMAALKVEAQAGRLDPADLDGGELDRVEELFQRTTQFNTTGRKFPVAELTRLIRSGAGAVFTLRVRDRFADHGLVGAAVAIGEEIAGFALSCRVIGLGVEDALIAAVTQAVCAEHGQVRARFVDSPRNARARNLYRDHGFVLATDGCWTIQAADRSRLCA